MGRDMNGAELFDLWTGSHGLSFKNQSSRPAATELVIFAYFWARVIHKRPRDSPETHSCLD